MIEVRHGSVTDSDVDVLVHASNTLGRLGSGVSAAIRHACGPGFQETIYRALPGGSMNPGDVVITDAGTHPRARYVAHVAVMDYRNDATQRSPDEARIRRASENLWRAIEAIEGGPFSVGMVALGAGTGGLGERAPTEIACETLKTHLSSTSNSKIARVVFHGFALHEYANILDVVRKRFELDLSTVPAEVLKLIDSIDPR